MRRCFALSTLDGDSKNGRETEIKEGCDDYCNFLKKDCEYGRSEALQFEFIIELNSQRLRIFACL